MNLRSLKNMDVKGKRVLLRVDFNVEIENGKPMGEFRIKSFGETINYLLKQDNTEIALISFLGRPGGRVVPELSFFQISDDIERILGVKIKFIDDCIGEKVKNGLAGLNKGEVLLLENVRFYPGEDKNDIDFSNKLAENFDIFVNDAMSICHRNQSSVTGVAKILPSFAGFQLEKEIENMEKIKENPEHPSIAIIGGAKIETKLPLIESFEKNYDFVLVGGKIANEAMDQKMSFSPKVIMPVDFAENRLDIGSKTIEDYKKVIAEAKTIIWNGPLGQFEIPPYDAGTKEILRAVVKSKAFTFAGGGETLQVLEKENLIDKFSFVSTAGGAMLEFLAGDKLPGIIALE